MKYYSMKQTKEMQDYLKLAWLLDYSLTSLLDLFKSSKANLGE